jgi:outer membrane lipoprotein-sorting protein
VIFSSLPCSFNPAKGTISMKASRILMFGLLSLAAVNSALATDVYPRVYDATFEIKNGKMVMPMHMLSNGKGLTRTETGMPGLPKTVTIMDYPNHTSYTIMEGQKMILKGPTKTAGKPMDADEAKRLNATDLGTKMVNNHMSQGWSYKNADGNTEIWVDKEAGVPVKSTSTSKGATSEMNIKSLSTTIPAEANFKVPAAGYKIMALH